MAWIGDSDIHCGQSLKKFDIFRLINACSQHYQRSIAAKNRAILRRVQTNGIAGVLLNAHNFKPTVASPQLLALKKTRTAFDGSVPGVNDRLIALPDGRQPAAVVEVAMRKNYCLNRLFTKAGRQGFDGFDDMAVATAVNQGIYVFQPVPVSPDQIGIAGVLAGS